MAFATRTSEQIRDGYLRDVRLLIPTARTEEGSYEWARGEAIANACLPFYANGAHFANQAFPDTGDATTLARFGSTYNVPRLGAQYAAGTVTVTGSFGTTFAAGTVLKNNANGSRYETVGTTTIDGSTLEGTAYVVALQTGSGSDADFGTVLTFESPPAGVDSAGTVVTISGGDAAWSNSRWASEILKRLRRAPLAGNVPHVLALCNAIPGVEQTFVYPCLRGSGTLDVVILTSAASGTRVAGTVLLAKVLGALQVGATAPGGAFIGGIPEDVFRNTTVAAAIEQIADIRLDYEASAANPWESWPPFGTGYVVPGTSTSWYVTTGTPTNASFRIAFPVSGTSVAPTVGDYIGAFFDDHGFCKTRIASVVTAGSYWTVTVDGWTDSNGTAPATTLDTGVTILPWNPQLVNIAGAPAEGSNALSGAVPDYLAALGPGEMTALTADDVTRRRRWPRTSDTSPITGEVEWPTDVTSRLTSAVLRATDAIDLTLTVSPSTPTVPNSAYIGSPPKVLVLGTLNVIPTT
jgi:hypothetical protein